MVMMSRVRVKLKVIIRVIVRVRAKVNIGGQEGAGATT
jgi:hypothetical protein